MPEPDAYGRLHQLLAAVPDPRGQRGRRHPLADVLFIVLVAVIAGAEDAQAVEDFAKYHEKWFRKRCGLPFGIPSQDTYLRVLAMLDPQAFGEAFERWVHQLWGGSERRHIAVDGKTLRRSFDRATGRSAVHAVAAFASAQGLLLGQVAVRDKENEIVAIPRLLTLLDLRGATVTVDAIGCQKTIARTITERGGHYVLQVKGNQSTLRHHIEAFFEDAARSSRPLDDPPPQLQSNEVTDCGHGRIETRRCLLSSDLSYLDTAAEWPALAAIAKVERIRQDKRSGQSSRQCAYYIVSDPEASAAQVNELVRSHWAIENCVHWVLDVTFDEDHCRIRNGNAAENFAIIKRAAINLLRSAPNPRPARHNVSIARRRRFCMMNEAYREAVLQLHPPSSA